MMGASTLIGIAKWDTLGRMTFFCNAHVHFLKVVACVNTLCDTEML